MRNAASSAAGWQRFGRIERKCPITHGLFVIDPTAVAPNNCFNLARTGVLFSQNNSESTAIHRLTITLASRAARRGCPLLRDLDELAAHRSTNRDRNVSA